jgi:hypothetical protein
LAPGYSIFQERLPEALRWVWRVIFIAFPLLFFVRIVSPDAAQAFLGSAVGQTVMGLLSYAGILVLVVAFFRRKE